MKVIQEVEEEYKKKDLLNLDHNDLNNNNNNKNKNINYKENN
jgi:hypothetical protein